MRRLFVAVELDDAVRAHCAAAAARLRDAGFAGRWVPPANYHLTVAFLGSVDDERVASVAAAVRGAVARAGAFEVPLEGVGAFPDARRVRIAWIGPRSAPPEFAALCAVVRSALGTLGFTFDVHSDAHVTLARADGRTALPPIEPPRPTVQRVASLTLFQSFTEREGARYVPLERFAFGSAQPETPNR